MIGSYIETLLPPIDPDHPMDGVNEAGRAREVMIERLKWGIQHLVIATAEQRCAVEDALVALEAGGGIYCGRELMPRHDPEHRVWRLARERRRAIILYLSATDLVAEVARVLNEENARLAEHRAETARVSEAARDRVSRRRWWKKAGEAAARHYRRDAGIKPMGSALSALAKSPYRHDDVTVFCGKDDDRIYFQHDDGRKQTISSKQFRDNYWGKVKVR